MRIENLIREQSTELNEYGKVLDFVKRHVSGTKSSAEKLMSHGLLAIDPKTLEVEVGTDVTITGPMPVIPIKFKETTRFGIALEMANLRSFKGLPRHFENRADLRILAGEFKSFDGFPETFSENCSISISGGIKSLHGLHQHVKMMPRIQLNVEVTNLLSVLLIERYSMPIDSKIFVVFDPFSADDENRDSEYDGMDLAIRLINRCFRRWDRRNNNQVSLEAQELLLENNLDKYADI